MKFDLFSLARTAIDVADNVNGMYNIDDDADGLSKYASQDDDMTNEQRALSFARAALNGDWFDAAKLTFDQIIKLVSKDPFSYQDFLDAISQYADAKIALISNTENLRFVGGECVLTVEEENKRVHSKVDLYFKNDNNAWIKKIIEGNTGLNCFTAETLDSDITDILESGERKCPILPPQKDME